MKKILRLMRCAPVLACISPCVGAQVPTSADADVSPDQLDRVIVVGRRNNLIGDAVTASEGGLNRQDIERRPRLRPGDLVEYVPGVVATQHSGSGKANQYFLRGFNLDHGTDFAQDIDGMPINMRTHGHGQGYTDLNFIIPELVDGLRYRKGPYHANVGDFSSAGSVSFRLSDGLSEGYAQLEAGSYGYARTVAADSHAWSDTELTWGVEAQTYRGPWKNIDEDVGKKNLFLRLSTPVGSGRGYAMVMAYDNRWNSPDQIPLRAVRTGLIDTLGSIDTTLGGESSRYSLTAGWDGHLLGGHTSATMYWIDYDMSLWSNFTYLLDDPVNGDQFRQFDVRKVMGFSADNEWSGERWKLTAGLDGRRDDIERVGLSRTRAREVIAAVRDDSVDERSLGIWAQGEWRASDRLRLNLGVRHDFYDFNVNALQPENSGSANDDIGTLNAGIAWNAVDKLELYANWGQGFHSNDARGTTITIDPVSGDPANSVTPLVRSHGSEIGMRWFQSGRWQLTMALWQVDLDSELLFVGDAGNTEVSRPSERKGIEVGWSLFAGPRSQLAVEASYTRARFRDYDPAGNRIPGAVPLVTSIEWTADWQRGWHSSVRARHLGAYPLIDDGSIESDGSTLVNLAIGKRWKHWGIELDVMNLLDSDDHDIDYFYSSRLSGEAVDGVEDLHFHVFEPRSYRLRLTRRF